MSRQDDFSGYLGHLIRLFQVEDVTPMKLRQINTVSGVLGEGRKGTRFAMVSCVCFKSVFSSTRRGTVVAGVYV
jgi:hypothetical protein